MTSPVEQDEPVNCKICTCGAAALRA